MQFINENDVEAFKNALPSVELESCSNGKDSDGSTLMQLAVIKDKADFVEALLFANVDANIGEGGQKPSSKALLLAAKLGRDKILKLFMDYGRKENHSSEANSNFKTEFDVCIENGSEACLSQTKMNLCGGENVLHLGKLGNNLVLCLIALPNLK